MTFYEISSNDDEYVSGIACALESDDEKEKYDAGNYDDLLNGCDYMDDDICFYVMPDEDIYDENMQLSLQEALGVSCNVSVLDLDE